MSVNFGLAQQSNHFLIGTVLLYSLALLAFAGDFAFGRHPSQGETPAAEVPELVAAGVPAASVGTGPGSGATGSELAGSGPGATGYAPRLPAADQGGRSRGSWLPAGSWVRAALALSALGLAAHVIGVTTRGLAVHRVPWGDMYEFVTSVTCVAAIFFLALMIRYRAYYLGLFVMAPVLLALGLAETVIYTPAGQIAVALQSYWLAIHVTAMTLATGTFVVGAALAVVYLLADRYARRVAAGQAVRVGRGIPVAARAGGHRPLRLPDRDVRLPDLDIRHHGRSDLGGYRVGPVLGLGPHRDLGLHYLGGIRLLPARARHGGLARPPGRLHSADRVRLPAVQSAWREHLHHRPAFLRGPELTARPRGPTRSRTNSSGHPEAARRSTQSAR